MKRIVLFLITLAMLGIGCAGEDGATGPKGDKGDKGDPGDPGDGLTGMVWYSTTPIATNASFCVTIPGLNVQNNRMVSISVYGRLDGTDLWYELPAFFNGMDDFGQFYAFGGDQVCFNNCLSLWIAVVIIE